jgi:hypothetical protein
MRREVSRKARSDLVGFTEGERDFEGVVGALGVGSVMGALGSEDDGLAVGAGCPSDVVCSESGLDPSNISSCCLFASASCCRGG